MSGDRWDTQLGIDTESERFLSNFSIAHNLKDVAVVDIAADWGAATESWYDGYTYELVTTVPERFRLSYRIPELGEPGFFVTSANEKESKANMNMSIAGVEAFVGGS